MTEAKQIVIDWCSQVHWTHPATINLLPHYKAEFVCRQFIRNFNRAIFGRDKMRTGLFHLLVLSVYADDSKVKHIHFCFGGFPPLMSIYQIRKAFYKAARQTKGVWLERTIPNTVVAVKMVNIECDPTPNKWLSYILRYTKDIDDKHLLIHQSYFG